MALWTKWKCLAFLWMWNVMILNHIANKNYYVIHPKSVTWTWYSLSPSLSAISYHCRQTHWKMWCQKLCILLGWRQVDSNFWHAHYNQMAMHTCTFTARQANSVDLRQRRDGMRARTNCVFKTTMTPFTLVRAFISFFHIEMMMFQFQHKFLFRKKRWSFRNVWHRYRSHIAVWIDTEKDRIKHLHFWFQAMNMIFIMEHQRGKKHWLHNV